MKVKHLVVDSGALIKNAPLHEISENIYTVEELICEIKDKATKQRLQSLPYEFKFRKPSSEIIKLVTEFSKKTGDYPSLSATDIQLIGLTFMLEKENVGTEHLNIKAPVNQTNVEPYSIEKGSSLIGFYFPSSDESSENRDLETETISRNQETFNNLEEKNPNLNDKKERNLIDSINTESEEIINIKNQKNDDDDDEGWITPSNIENVKKEMNCLTIDVPIVVACITTDFAMQNVLIQMGLKVVSLDGMQIRKVKTFILRCHACFKITSDMNKKFCPNCGNQTLKRVSVTINEDGTKSVHINFRKPINIRGIRQSLPLPKGGKHANNPILFEDQPIPQNRPSRLARTKIDVFDPDYVAGSSPFTINDVYSRAANLGIRNKKSNKRNHVRKK